MARGTFSHRVFRRLRGSSGSSLVEAALITPLLLLLTIGIMEFASMFYAYLALENGVSQATRFAVTGNLMTDPNNPSQTLSRTDSIKTAMRQATPTLTIVDGEFSFTHLPPGGSSWVSGVGGPSDIEKVTVNHTWTFYTPLFSVFFTGGQLAMQVDSAMKYEGRFN